MKRRTFTMLAGAACLGFVGVDFAGTKDLAFLARRFRLSLARENELIHLVGRVSREDLASCFQALNEVSDGPLLVAGNRVTGSFSGRPFQAEIFS